MKWYNNKEEIISAGLIALCYGGEDIMAFSDAEHIKGIPLFDHWFTGDEFKHDFRNIWRIQFDDSGITTCNLINY